MDEEQPTPASAPAVDAVPVPAPDSVDQTTATERPPAADTTRSRRRLQVAVALTLIAAVVILGALQVSGVLRIGGGGGTGGGTGGASAIPAPPRIAAVDPSGVLTTMDDHGGSVVPHPVAATGFQFPAWSPDGTRVAAIGTATDSGGIYVFRARGDGGADAAATDPTVIYRSPDKQPFYLYWTPDGRQVTFLTNEAEGLALRAAPADASSEAVVVTHGAPLYWDWVDPGRVMVNVAAGGPDAFLGEVGLDGTAGRPTAKAAVFRSPAVTRDRSHRAYITGATTGSESIVIEKPDGGDRHEIPTPGPAAIEFSAAGDRLAFIAPAAPSDDPPALPLGPLRVVDVASGSVRTILEGSAVAFFWSPDGRTIATLRLPAPGDEDLASTAALVPPFGAPTAGYSVRLVFVDVASGDARSSQTVQVSELFGLQMLPFFDQYALSHRLWSPDSSSLLLPIVGDDNTTGLVVLPADGSAPRRVAAGEMGSWSP
jgi:TolB protein